MGDRANVTAAAFPGRRDWRGGLRVHLGVRVVLFALAMSGVWSGAAGAAEAVQTPTTPAQAAQLGAEFGAAVAAYDAGRFAEAAAALERLAPRADSSFEVHELLGLAYGAQGKDAKAAEQMRRAAELRPGSAVAHTNLATGLVHAGKPREAEAECRKALAIEPGSYSANHTLAGLYLSENRVSDALPLLETAHRLRPEAADDAYNLALAFLAARRYGEARQLVEVLRARQDAGELHHVLGQIDEGEAKYVDAGNEFAAAARLDPSEDNLFVWASELLLHRAYPQAIAVFETAAKRYPESPRLWIGLGMARYSRGEYPESIQALLTAADLNPRDPRCYLFLSKAYLSAPSQAAAVIERFRRYAELEPGNALAQYDYAISLWKGGRVENPDVDYKAVEALLARSIELDGRYAPAHLELGILYNDERDYARSLPEYKRALDLDPGLADAHFRLARAYLRTGEKAKAQTEFEVFRKLQAQHQAEVDRERAEVQQFVVSTQAASPNQP